MSEADGGRRRKRGADEEEFSSGSNTSPDFNWIWSGESSLVSVVRISAANLASYELDLAYFEGA